MASIEDIKKLREETLASMIECRNALEEAGGDFEKARDILRKKGVRVAEKKAERWAGEGIIISYIHSNGKVGVLVELHCETDFVAKNEEFRKLGHEIAMQIAASSPQYLAPEDIPQEVLDAEKAIYEEQFRDSGKSEEVFRNIIGGKMQKYAQEHSLLTQPYIRDEDITIQDLINGYIAKLGENIRVTRFTRYQL